MKRRRGNGDGANNGDGEAAAEKYVSLTRSSFFILPDGAANANALQEAGNARQRTAAGPGARKKAKSSDTTHTTSTSAPAPAHLPFQRCVFDSTFTEPEALCALRQRKYTTAWRRVSAKIEDVLLSLNRDAIDNISRFVEMDHWPLDVTVLPNRRDIPTGIIISGLTLPTHDLLHRLFAHIQDLHPAPFPLYAPPDARHTDTDSPAPAPHVSVRVAHLVPSDCTTLRAALRVLIESFAFASSEGGVGGGGEEDPSDDEDPDPEDPDNFTVAPRPLDTTSTHFSFRRPTRTGRAVVHDMRVLLAWWRDERREGREHRLVVVVHDVEAWGAGVISDLISVIAEYTTSLPLILLLSLATSTDVLHQTLPSAVVGMMRPERFYLLQGGECLDGVVEELFVHSASPLKLSSALYSLLLDHFNARALSLPTFVHHLHYALLAHYFRDPLSVVTGVDPDEEGEGEWEKVLRLMEGVGDKEGNGGYGEMARVAWRSVVSLAESDPFPSPWDAAQVSSLLTCTPRVFLTHHVPEILRTLRTHAADREVSWRALKHLAAAAGVKFRAASVLRHVLDPEGTGLGGSEWMARVVGNVVRKSPRELAKVLEGVRDMLREVEGDAERSHRVRERAGEAADELEPVVEHVKRFDGVVAGVGVDLAALKRMASAAHGARRTKLARKLREEEEESRREAERGTWMGAVREVEGWIDAYINLGLRSSCAVGVVGWEVEYFDDVGVIENTFMPQLFPSSHVALAASATYLRCECCPVPQRHGEHVVSPTMHDTSIAYGLYLEQGKLINMYDWFQSFKAVVAPEERGHADGAGELGERDGSGGGAETPTKGSAKGKGKATVRNGSGGQESRGAMNGSTDDGESGELAVGDLTCDADLKMVQVRFARATAELQMLGYIRPTKRKTDHVAKLKFV
ncbi:hypothetical protein M427DRAFT_153635 [Gonapodya prolifera JEL478]|uniref:Uncharacterized protein n=1 Tax=Gonapodya prolifera (strain JEL478) TaxID=1344416 RepID=A0A139AMR2_GONPJ|nr:hypothetical protein M427DRAFT_153635 [Gonapodya prolifera JEL478]|eukprot:KXS17745.1 hypothetical protein M427DRAFT_153635 [Gonapodya prolifera JEL478]